MPPPNAQRAPLPPLQGYLYARACRGDNEYAHPLDLCPLVDLNAGRVVHVDMYDEPARMPPMMVRRLARWWRLPQVREGHGRWQIEHVVMTTIIIIIIIFLLCEPPTPLLLLTAGALVLFA